MAKLHSIFFDAGNTLVHINMPYIAGILAEYGVHKTPEELWKIEYRVRLKFDQPDIIRSTTDSSRFPLYFSTILREVGLETDAALKPALRRLQEYMNRYNLWDYPEPEVVPLLDRLRQKGYLLGIITNSPGTAEALLQRLGIAPHVDTIVDSGRVGVEKPDSRIFHMAMERLHAPPDRSIFIGDLYHVDVVGAEQAGMRGVLLDPDGLHVHRTCPRIRSLAELESLLDSLMPL